jgi:hypothetical protein
MKVKAKRGVCIGVNNHLKVGEEADLDPGTVQFLVSIGAVERVPDPPPAAPDPEPASAPAPDPVEADPPQAEKPKKAGK